MQVIEDLKQIGFDIWVDQGKIRFKQIAEGADKARVDVLLAEIKAHKEEAIRYLQQKTSVSVPIGTPWQSSDDCSGCRYLIRWPDYPLGGGTKYFCGYWVLIQGKAKKIELSKVTSCPKDGVKIT